MVIALLNSFDIYEKLFLSTEDFFILLKNMELLARFLVYFGGAFLGIGVIMLSFLRRRMINHSKRVKKQRKLEKIMKQNGVHLPWDQKK